MKLSSYWLSEEAARDLDSIWIYTFHQWSEEQADKYYRGLIDGFRFLTDNPEAGKSAEHFGEGYSMFQIQSHLIFYRMENSKTLAITRILHHAMNAKNQFT